MKWQDIILAMCLFAFNTALVPSLFGKQKPRLATSVITSLFVMPQMVVFFTLSLWFSLAMSTVNWLLWTILVIQKWRIDKNISSQKI